VGFVLQVEPPEQGRWSGAVGNRARTAGDCADPECREDAPEFWEAPAASTAAARDGSHDPLHHHPQRCPIGTGVKSDATEGWSRCHVRFERLLRPTSKIVRLARWGNLAQVLALRAEIIAWTSRD
jgi:hypothetical protein